MLYSEDSQSCDCSQNSQGWTCEMQLEELNITGEQSNDNWHVGLDCIPDEWAGMTNLTKLELRGHSLLNVCTP